MSDTIKPGDFVRSFDFDLQSLEGERACYCEGTVKAIKNLGGCDRYEIEVTRRVLCGEVSGPREGEETVYPPVNGTPSLFSGPTCCVVKIDPSELN